MKDMKVIPCEEVVYQHRIVVSDAKIKHRKEDKQPFVPKIKV